MLVPGGYLAVNVGSVLDNGYHYPLAEDIRYQKLKILLLPYPILAFPQKVMLLSMTTKMARMQPLDFGGC